MKIRPAAILTSPKLAVALMLYSAFFVFVLTVDQTRLGVDGAVEKYVQSFFCAVDLPFFPYKIPLLGGFFVGAVYVAVLSASLITYKKGKMQAFGFAMVHASLVLLVISGFLQCFWRKQAYLTLSENQTANQLTLYSQNGKAAGNIPLLYSITLKKFETKNWQNSDIAKEYSSTLAFEKDGVIDIKTVKMNEPVQYGAWTYFQSGHLNDGKTTVLLAVKNPVKILPYLALILVVLGALIMYSQKLFAARK